MTSKTDPRLTPRQRLGRGLAYTAVGPVDIARGAVGVSVQSLSATASGLRQQYRKSQLRKELTAAQEAVQDVVARELSVAQDVVAALPLVIQDARKPRRRPLRLILAGVGVLGLGAVAFSVLRRSRQPEPSPLPPSVQVEPKP